MRNEETLNKLKNMRLTGMAEAYENQTEDKEINKLSFDVCCILKVVHYSASCR